MSFTYYVSWNFTFSFLCWSFRGSQPNAFAVGECHHTFLLHFILQYLRFSSRLQEKCFRVSFGPYVSSRRSKGFGPEYAARSEGASPPLNAWPIPDRSFSIVRNFCMLSTVEVNTIEQLFFSKRDRLQATTCLSRVSWFQSLPRDVPGFRRTRLGIVCHSYQFPSRKSWLAEPSTLVLNIQFFDIFKRPLLYLYILCPVWCSVRIFSVEISPESSNYDLLSSSAHLFIFCLFTCYERQERIFGFPSHSSSWLWMSLL